MRASAMLSMVHDGPCCLGSVKQRGLKGKIVQLGPLNTYVTGDGKPAGAAVLIVPDIYGFSIPNTRSSVV